MLVYNLCTRDYKSNTLTASLRMQPAIVVNSIVTYKCMNDSVLGSLYVHVRRHRVRQNKAWWPQWSCNSGAFAHNSTRSTYETWRTIQLYNISLTSKTVYTPNTVEKFWAWKKLAIIHDIINRIGMIWVTS